METNKKQLIVFVDQTKFGGLLKNGFIMNDNQIAYLTENELEIKRNEALDLTLLRSSSIIIKTDTNNYDYTPQHPFKILYHGNTQKYNSSNHLNNLKKDKNCEGWKEQPEEKETFYEDIARLIDKIEGHKSFSNIYQSIPKKNYKLEIALEFLHNCLGNNNSIPTLPAEFENCQKEYTAFETVRENENFELLRDVMLAEAGVIGKN